MAVENLFGEPEKKLRVRILARQIRGQCERLVQLVDRARDEVKDLPAEDKDALREWFVALKKDLAERI